ncbi:MAG: ATP-dependent DNA ligase [Gemmatimonadaceae bacterium]
MTLPLKYDYEPMEALAVDELPKGDEWQYEPKWDGFRCIAFRNGSKVELRSKSGNSLSRYFPELLAALGALKAKQFVLDGEIVVTDPTQKALSFDTLLQRIHPAASRVTKLSNETPATFIVFDMLVDESGRSLVDEPLFARRAALEDFVQRFLDRASESVVQLSPISYDIRAARGWLAGRAGLDGVVAKRIDLQYDPGERGAMQKVKRIRSADCVVGGFRYASNGHAIGSLLLGLYDDEGLLNHVGYTSSFADDERKALVPKLEKLIQEPGFTGRKPGGPSRWSTKRSTEWEPLATELVVEVKYDHFSSDRFRHGTTFMRWRPDKAPRQCRMDQVETAGASALRLLGDDDG